ncbi:MAG TPA: undecaprenyldiphospho-muramoylpentapeptide beta-N-acetylglucosaminyltransferase [Cryomorphaceae bacterium]|nr:undecaprenyldiphospho-muramoylpentapeptide beta-N-acetylglucosaminyltransferase [Cryomorphaceae bacterium]
MSKTFIISGGGTGGHIFPAVSIATELKNRHPGAKIHFVGALGKMEMTKVPAAGFQITGVPIAGINRKKPWKSWNVPFKLLVALVRCRTLLKTMKPDAVIGTGGYASGPVLLMAQRMGIPTVVQEQNSYAGITNIRLGKKAKYICTAYENAARFFPTDRVRLTGNPIRKVFTRELPDQRASKSAIGFDPKKKLLLVLGGSLGARAINRQMAKSLEDIKAQGWQVMWQCGKLYEEEYNGKSGNGTKVQAFIEDMSVAYAAADAIVSRAGAGTLSELCLIGKPALLIPSPNVAEDHQTHNARALSEKGAAILVMEKNMEEQFLVEITTLQNEKIAEKMSAAIRGMALPKATSDIADLIDGLGE